MSDEMPELLPCPLPTCRGTAEFSMGEKGDGSPWRYIECVKCGLTSADDNVEHWNTRSNPAPVTDEAIRLLDGIDAIIKETLSKNRQALGVHIQKDDIEVLLKAHDQCRAALSAPAVTDEARAEALAALEKLANTRMELSLGEWVNICSTIRAALSAPSRGLMDSHE